MSPARGPGPPTERERWAWAWYDFGSSGYATLVLTALYSAYFVAEVARPWTPAAATLAWTATLAAANGLALGLGPWLGALADAHGLKKRLLVGVTVLCALAAAALSLFGPGMALAAMAVLVVAQTCFALSENLAAAFLPELAPPEAQGRLSARGWGLGYVGGLASLGLAWALVGRWGVPAALVGVGLFFLAGAAPAFRYLRERRVASAAPPAGLGDAWRLLGPLVDLRRFLVALALYAAGSSTVVALAAVYADQVLGMGPRETLALLVGVNVCGALGAWAAGPVQDRVGSVPTLRVALGLWVAALSAIALAPGSPVFWAAAMALGLALGATQTLGRALAAKLTPPGHSGAVLGLWGAALRLSAIVGPLGYGLAVVALPGPLGQRAALAATTLFFLAGALRLSGVDEARGLRAARQMGKINNFE